MTTDGLTGRFSRRAGRMTALATAAAVALALAGCGGRSDPATDPATLRVLAGSEVRDMKPILEAAREATGVTVEIDEVGTLEGADLVASGEAAAEHDATWFSSNRYLSLLPGAANEVTSPTKIMASPVLLGLRESKVAELGWDDRAPTWAEIARAASEKRFTYGMTNPSSSNSGFSALVGVATALDGSGSALDAAATERATPQLKGFFAGQALTSGSSGWLADKFIERAEQGDPIDGLVNYESVIRKMDTGALGERLVPIYPADGVITADYPLALLTKAPEGKKESFDKLTAWLRSPEAQQRIMDEVGRRPITGVHPDPKAFPAVIDLPFPAQRDAADGLIAAYLNTFSKPSRTAYALDISESMTEEGRISQLRESLRALAGTDAQGRDSTNRSFTRFRNREQVTLVPFSGWAGEPMVFSVPETRPETELARIAEAADSLEPYGKTAIYDALQAAYEQVMGGGGESGEAFTSVVLMTDGKLTNGQSAADFERWYNAQPQRIRSVPTFTVLFGDADPTELEGIAELTGGKVFDARDSDLASIFKEIRGYQ